MGTQLLLTLHQVDERSRFHPLPPVRAPSRSTLLITTTALRFNSIALRRTNGSGAWRLKHPQRSTPLPFWPAPLHRQSQHVQVSTMLIFIP